MELMGGRGVGAPDGGVLGGVGRLVEGHLFQVPEVPLLTAAHQQLQLLRAEQLTRRTQRQLVVRCALPCVSCRVRVMSCRVVS
jgi:hypothetical protein